MVLREDVSCRMPGNVIVDILVCFKVKIIKMKDLEGSEGHNAELLKRLSTGFYLIKANYKIGKN